MQIPPKMRSSTPGSFARTTIERRFPRIVSDAAHELGGGSCGPLQRLLDDIQRNRAVDPALLRGRTAWWDKRGDDAEGTSWLDWPFMDLEFMFYRAIDRIADGTDPFVMVKRRGFDAVDGAFLADLDRASCSPNSVAALLAESTFANDHDLSQIATDDSPGHERRTDRLLADERTSWTSGIANRGGDGVGILLDNVGRELTADVALALALLDRRDIPRVHLYAKAMPMFVSDATPDDVARWVEMAAVSASPLLQSMADRVRKEMVAGRIAVSSSEEWSEARPFCALSATLVEKLASHSAVVAKGDLNYRRFIEDRAWPPRAPAGIATRDVPFRALTLRTLKSEVLVGIDDAELQRARSARRDWMTDGFFGVIQVLGGA